MFELEPFQLVVLLFGGLALLVFAISKISHAGFSQTVTQTERGLL